METLYIVDIFQAVVEKEKGALLAKIKELEARLQVDKLTDRYGYNDHYLLQATSGSFLEEYYGGRRSILY